MLVNYGEVYSYELFDDGYDIYKGEQKILTQREPYAHIFVAKGSYEENAKAHIDDIIRAEEEAEKAVSDTQKLRADMDFMALMLDVALPSEEESQAEEEE